MPKPKIIQDDPTRLLIRERTLIWPVFFLGFVVVPAYFYMYFFFDTGRLQCDKRGKCTFVTKSLTETFQRSFKRSDIQKIRLHQKYDKDDDLSCRTELKIKGKWVATHQIWGDCSADKKKAYRAFLAKYRSRRAFAHEFSSKLHWLGHMMMFVFLLIGLLSTWVLTRQTFIDLDLRREQFVVLYRDLFFFDTVKHRLPFEEIHAVEVARGEDSDGDPTHFLELHLHDGQVIKLTRFEAPDNYKHDIEHMRDKIVQTLLGL
jgi:hypothetical protein